MLASLIPIDLNRVLDEFKKKIVQIKHIGSGFYFYLARTKESKVKSEYEGKKRSI